MARSNLLDTHTATFVDLIGNGKSYRVPPYQRNYSWSEEQWEDLWSDVLALSSAPDDRHYMGALVVEAINEREYQIIDGQQRIATLSILALAVIDTLKNVGDDSERERNAERANLLRRQFIGDKNPTSLLESSKLTLNETNSAFYQDYLVQLRAPNNPRGLPKSNRLLWQCFQWFKSRLQDSGYSGEALARLLDQPVARQLMFILITVDDELNAYTVFETLNARGLELSTTDLLKNWLFSRIRDASDLAALQRRWSSLIAVVQEERFPEFLRYHLLCDNPKIRKERLFKMIRGLVQSDVEVFGLMDSLEARAELFAALDDAEHEYWIDLPSARHYIRELQLFRVRQMTPLLFAAWERLSQPDFVRILKLVSVISLRHTVIGSRNPNELEPTYHRAAKALLTGAAQSPADVFSNLTSIYVDDAAFKQDFATTEIKTHGQRKRLAKYLLCKLESDAAGRDVEFESDSASVEHVLPENPTADWEQYFRPERQNDYIYRIGNLTLLEPTLNREVGNNLFDAKREVYERSRYVLTQNLVAQAPEEWTPAALEDRQKRLADRAVHVWRSDFA